MSRAISATRIHARSYLQACLPVHTSLSFVFSVSTVSMYVDLLTKRGLWTFHVSSPDFNKMDLQIVAICLFVCVCVHKHVKIVTFT